MRCGVHQVAAGPGGRCAPCPPNETSPPPTMRISPLPPALRRAAAAPDEAALRPESSLSSESPSANGERAAETPAEDEAEPEAPDPPDPPADELPAPAPA